MKDMYITEELNISNFENHVQFQAVASLFQYSGSFNLLGRKVGDDTRIQESIKRLDEVGIPFRVDPSVPTIFQVEHRGSDIRFFALADFAFAVEVPDWLRQCFGYIWALFLECVPDMVGRDDV